MTDFTFMFNYFATRFRVQNLKLESWHFRHLSSSWSCSSSSCRFFFLGMMDSPAKNLATASADLTISGRSYVWDTWTPYTKLALKDTENSTNLESFDFDINCEKIGLRWPLCKCGLIDAVRLMRFWSADRMIKALCGSVKWWSQFVHSTA